MEAREGKLISCQFSGILFPSLGFFFCLLCKLKRLKSVVSPNAAPVITHCQINTIFFAVGKGILPDSFLSLYSFFFINSSNADARESHTEERSCVWDGK